MMTIHAEVQLLNDKVRKTPFGFRRGKLVDEKVKYMEKLGEESLKLEKEAEKAQGFMKRIQGKLSMPAKIIRLIGVVIAVLFISFLIWDIACHGGEMSGGQLALSIINIILEVAIVICEIVSVFVPALTIIPVIGQILAFAVLVLGVLMLIFGGTAHQKTPGEKFVDRMQATDGWVTKLRSPPEPLLTASISAQSGPKGSQRAFAFILTNETTRTITFTEAAADVPGTPESTDTINSLEVSFFAGSDASTLFSNGAFAGPGETVPFGSGTWSVATPPGPPATWKTDLLKPNGTSLKSTNYILRVKAAAAAPGGTPATIAPGQSFALTVSGSLGGEAGTAVVKVVERRPGAGFCPVTFTVTRE
jgi:hypothetical protein